jgi:hypothetical protein
VGTDLLLKSGSMTFEVSKSTFSHISCSKKFKTVLILQDLGPIFKRHSKITKVIANKISKMLRRRGFGKIQKSCQTKGFKKKISVNVQNQDKLFKI